MAATDPKNYPLDLINALLPIATMLKEKGTISMNEIEDLFTNKEISEALPMRTLFNQHMKTIMSEKFKGLDLTEVSEQMMKSTPSPSHESVVGLIKAVESICETIVTQELNSPSVKKALEDLKTNPSVRYLMLVHTEEDIMKQNVDD